MKPQLLTTSRKRNLQTEENRSALRRLGVTVQQLLSVPEITPQLKKAEGGLKQCMSAMRFSRKDPVIHQFLVKFDSLSAHDCRSVPWEAVAVSVGLDVDQLYGSIWRALQRQCVDTSKMLVMTAHPKIVEARVKFGLLPLGERDRTALDTAVGFLPSPKGATFISKAIFGSGQNVMMQQREADEDDGDRTLRPDEIDLDTLFPPPRLMQEKLNSIRQRRLPEPDKSQEDPPESQ